jgi:small subunit ribosomal protein S16
MAVHIRLARHGTKKSPYYRIVVTDQRTPRDGRFIDKLGTYDPLARDGGLTIDRARLSHWERLGAQLSETVRRLLKKNPGSEATAS